MTICVHSEYVPVEVNVTDSESTPKERGAVPSELKLMGVVETPGDPAIAPRLAEGYVSRPRSGTSFDALAHDVVVRVPGALKPGVSRRPSVIVLLSSSVPTGPTYPVSSSVRRTFAAPELTTVTDVSFIWA